MKIFKDIRYFFNELEDSFNNDKFESPDLLYVDLSLYPDRIKAPLIIYLLEHFKHLNGKRIFILDECWNLLTNHGQFIAESFRTFRNMELLQLRFLKILKIFYLLHLDERFITSTFIKFIFRQETSGEFLTDHQKEICLKV
jgi:hypothetical protein